MIVCDNPLAWGELKQFLQKFISYLQTFDTCYGNPTTGIKEFPLSELHFNAIAKALNHMDKKEFQDAYVCLLTLVENDTWVLMVDEVPETQLTRDEFMNVKKIDGAFT